ncbi:MAG TPA: hypothetical protein VGL50_02730 [Steroidobacteraceae bacterium]|jgi:catechol 2,3-dioxygenase-like lactoylglutathione lyase family enzyme
MPVVGVDHVQLAMPAGGEDRARAFYRDVLGVPEKPKPNVAGRGGCWFENELVKIHLGIDPSFRAATKAHPGLVVTGMDAILERSRQLGLQTMDGAPFAHYRRAFVIDPFGNRIELMERR